MGEDSLRRIQLIIKTNLEKSRKRNQENLQKQNSEQQKNLHSEYKCSKCCDTGWLLTRQEHGQPIARPCECRKVRKTEDQWKKSGLNPEMHEYTFTSFKVWNENSKNAKETAVVFYTDFKKIRKTRANSIIFCGQVGSGKTHLSVALAQNFMKQNVSVVYMPYRDIITKIKQNICDNEYYEKMISRYQTCEVLLIDDLFKGKVTESDINIVFEIINYRYLNCLPIIISTEFSIEKLLYFDEGVGSRIYEMCSEYLVENKKNPKNNYRLR